MRTASGKAVFASLAIHAGVVVAAMRFWTMPAREPGPDSECFSVCLVSPVPEPPLLAVDEQKALVDVTTDEVIAKEVRTKPEIAPVPVEIPATIEVAVKSAALPPEPPATPVPSRVVETQPLKGKSIAKTPAGTPLPPGTRANAPASGSKNRGAETATIPPKLKSKSAPRYRETAEMRGKRLTVWLTLEVNERGHVSAVRVKRGSGYQELDEAAEAAVKRYRFAPALTSGRPVSWTFDHAVTFAL